MEVEVICPVCKEKFKMRIDYQPRASFVRSPKRCYLTLDLSSNGWEHQCEQFQG